MINCIKLDKFHIWSNAKQAKGFFYCENKFLNQNKIASNMNENQGQTVDKSSV